MEFIMEFEGLAPTLHDRYENIWTGSILTKPVLTITDQFAFVQVEEE